MKIFDPHVHMTSRTTDDYEAMARGRHRRDRRAGVLARPAAHARRQLRRLFQQPARMGALPRLAVRHPPLLHHRPESEGSEQPEAVRRSARRCCRGSSPRTASSPSARSASTIRPTRKKPCFARQIELAARIQSADPDAHAASRQEARHDPLDRAGAVAEVSRRARAHRSQQRRDAADRARERVLGRPHDLSEHQDGRAAHGRAGARSTAPIASSSTAPPTGASAIR